MIVGLAIAVPLVAALVVALGPRGLAPRLLLLTALADLGLSILAVVTSDAIAHPVVLLSGSLVLDPTSLLFLPIDNAVFLGISVYLVNRARIAPSGPARLPRVAALSLTFMAAMNLAILSNHLIFMWAVIELTTLVAAPLVAEGSGRAALQAAWRYLLFSSVCLAVAFLGFLCLERSAELHGVVLDFSLDALPAALAGRADVWHRLGLALLLLGLGGKLGLAPMYGWLPEAYSAAPPSTTAMLAAIQFNATVVAVFRVLEATRGADEGLVSVELIALGVASLVVSAVNIAATGNYKRLIAYACISSSGVIAIGLGIGHAAAYGVVLYVVSNAFVKALLFLTAGRLRSAFETERVAELSGLVKSMPFTGFLCMVGIFALLGFPPFGSFMAEMLILSGIIQTGNYVVFVVFCGLLTVVFVATGRTVFPMLWGETRREPRLREESALHFLPKITFVVVLVILGVYVPAPLTDLFQRVAVSIGGR
jgi:hydrogenase-4 component F